MTRCQYYVLSHKMTKHPTEIIATIYSTDESNTYSLIDDKYMRHVENDIYYLLVLNRYHRDHMEHEIHYNADKILEFLDNFKSDDDEFTEVKINKKYFDCGIEKISFISQNDQRSGYHNAVVQVTFNLKQYLEKDHKDIYDNVCDALDNVDVKHYGNMLWK